MKEQILEKEEKFHDEWASSINVDEVMVDETFEAQVSPENRLIMKRLGDIRGKKILELGSGAGEAAVYFAKKGADVTATDISENMLRVVKQVAQKHKVSLNTVKCHSDHTPFSDESFDIVYAANLLHHVDIEATLKEVKRILKKGGIFVSWDPIGHNPMINIYRRMATKVRTADEHPIVMSDLKKFRGIFSRVDFETTWLFTLLIFVKFYLIDRIHPNDERYWKKILLEHKKLERLHRTLESVDRFVLKTFPFMKRFCWNIVIFSTKQ